MQQPKLADRISNMMRVHTPSQQVQQKLNELSLLSNYQMKSSLGIPQLNVLFPSLFPHHNQNIKERKEQKPEQANNQQVVLYDLTQNQQSKQRNERQTAQIPVQIDNQIKIKIDKQKYPNINIKVNSSIKVVDKVNKTITIQQEQRFMRKRDKSIVISDQQRQDENQSAQQFLTLSSIHQYSNIDYTPIDDPNYVPKIESDEQIQRLIYAVFNNLDQNIQTNSRYQNMHRDYVNRGGLRNLQQFKQKIIEDLMYISTLEIKKHKYRKQPIN